MMALLVVGCAASEEQDPNFGTIGFVEGFLGGVVADEPQAALIGRDILSRGGSAADAATAMYFAMAVTMPSSASLGGGGVCIAFDGETGEVRALDFLARPPQRVGPGAERPAAIPGSVRGFYALQARYGKLRWSELLAPAEQLARFGSQVSRAFARDLSRVSDALAAEPDARRIFSVPDGSRLVREGDFMQQLDLAAMLSSIRVNGPGPFYAQALARQFTEAAADAGGALDPADLREYQPVWRDTIALSFSNEMVHFPAPPPSAGAVAAQMWAMLDDGDRFDDAPEAERSHLIAEAALRAYAERTRWAAGGDAAIADPQGLIAEPLIDSLMSTYSPDTHRNPVELGLSIATGPENPSAAGFVAFDRKGSAVSCAVTLNSLFGTGRIAPGTGIFLASLPGQGGRGAASLGPMLVVNQHANEAHFGAVASGGLAAPVAMVSVAARTVLAGEPLNQALAAKRVYTSGDPDLVFVEEGMDAAAAQGLQQRVHRTAGTPSLGLVNAISCPDGVRQKPETCEAGADPRGHGLALSAD